MSGAIANAVLHMLHVVVIVFCLVGWAFPETRVYHLTLCGLTLVSWFVVGPLIGHPGYCFLTGIQHSLWARQGRTERPNYMSYLFERLTGRKPEAAGVHAIDLATQVVFYSCMLLSIVL